MPLLEPLSVVFSQLLAYTLQVCSAAVTIHIETLLLTPDLEVLESGIKRIISQSQTKEWFYGILTMLDRSSERWRSGERGVRSTAEGSIKDGDRGG